MFRALVLTLVFLIIGIIFFTFIVEPRLMSQNQKDGKTTPTPLVQPTPDQKLMDTVAAARRVEEFYDYYLNCQRNTCKEAFAFVSQNIEAQLQSNTAETRTKIVCGTMLPDRIKVKISSINLMGGIIVKAQPMFKNADGTMITLDLQNEDNEWVIEAIKCGE